MRTVVSHGPFDDGVDHPGGSDPRVNICLGLGEESSRPEKSRLCKFGVVEDIG